MFKLTSISKFMRKRKKNAEKENYTKRPKFDLNIGFTDSIRMRQYEFINIV